MSEDRTSVNKKLRRRVFLRWTNHFLQERNHHIKSLSELSNGILLAELIEILSGERIIPQGKKGGDQNDLVTPFNFMKKEEIKENVSACLNYLRKIMDLSVSEEDLINEAKSDTASSKSIESLLWDILRAFHFQTPNESSKYIIRKTLRWLSRIGLMTDKTVTRIEAKSYLSGLITYLIPATGIGEINKVTSSVGNLIRYSSERLKIPIMLDEINLVEDEQYDLVSFLIYIQFFKEKAMKVYKKKTSTKDKTHKKALSSSHQVGGHTKEKIEIESTHSLSESPKHMRIRGGITSTKSTPTVALMKGSRDSDSSDNAMSSHESLDPPRSEEKKLKKKSKTVSDKHRRLKSQNPNASKSSTINSTSGSRSTASTPTSLETLIKSTERTETLNRTTSKNLSTSSSSSEPIKKKTNRSSSFSHRSSKEPIPVKLSEDSSKPKKSPSNSKAQESTQMIRVRIEGFKPIQPNSSIKKEAKNFEELQIERESELHVVSGNNSDSSSSSPVIVSQTVTSQTPTKVSPNRSIPKGPRRSQSQQLPATILDEVSMKVEQSSYTTDTIAEETTSSNDSSRSSSPTPMNDEREAKKKEMEERRLKKLEEAKRRQIEMENKRNEKLIQAEMRKHQKFQPSSTSSTTSSPGESNSGNSSTEEIAIKITIQNSDETDNLLASPTPASTSNSTSITTTATATATATGTGDSSTTAANSSNSSIGNSYDSNLSGSSPVTDTGVVAAADAAASASSSSGVGLGPTQENKIQPEAEPQATQIPEPVIVPVSPVEKCQELLEQMNKVLIDKTPPELHYRDSNIIEFLTLVVGHVKLFGTLSKKKQFTTICMENDSEIIEFGLSIHQVLYTLIMALRSNYHLIYDPQIKMEIVGSVFKLAKHSASIIRIFYLLLKVLFYLIGFIMCVWEMWSVCL
eukprot:TRINITY_DN352_c0_g1_i1.p1 TRINITY_DN352_c0_g1~~TRINITY_DN352_c0_g1_i1.p1  ORF type:complete len:914 (+),score=203.58 TRINITY_DN352_c0_g1_i1:23-2764(+)